MADTDQTPTPILDTDAPTLSVSMPSSEPVHKYAKKPNIKLLLLGLFLLLVTLPLSLLFIQQQQEIRSKAADPYKQCMDGCAKMQKSDAKQACKNECDKLKNTTNTQTGEISVNQANCKPPVGFWCSPCGGFCITGNSVTCNQAAAIKCNAVAQTGANFIVGTCNATYNIGCTCNGTHVCFDRGQPDGSQCNTSDGLCAVYTNSSSQKQGGMFFCKNVGSTNGVPNSCDESTGGVAITSIPDCFCGVIQVDTAGGGYKSYTGTCGCTKTTTNAPTPTPTKLPTPTPTPTGGQTPTPSPTEGPTPTPTPSPTNGPTPTPTPTPKPPLTCNSACTVNADCQNGLVCIDSACRNPSCTGQTNCVCGQAIVPTPKIPVSGTGPSVLGASVIAGGFLILLLGLAL